MDLTLTTDVARIAAESSSVSELARPLLEILHKMTGLDTTYLTEVREEKNEQEILYSENFGDINIPEGLIVPWNDTLCKRALISGTRQTDEVPLIWGDSQAAQDLGLQTYVSVPVTNEKDVVIGTLCGASGAKKLQSEEIMNIMELFARLIADQWRRDRQLHDAEERAHDAEEQLRERATQLAENEHKLKTPLTVIKGWASMLDDEETEMPEKQRAEALTRIRTAADKLADQLDELINEQRRVATQRAALVMEDVHIDDLLNQVRDELSGMSKNHEIVVDFDHPFVAVSNETTLWHILGHLGENAVKYSPAGATVRLSAQKVGHNAVITVADTGPGLPVGVDVFSPFVRGDEDATKGSGLGLHIVRTLVGSLKGEVSVQSTPGEGTTFTVLLPHSAKE